jgi:ribosomal-protein-alanine N-acetyltransferase
VHTKRIETERAVRNMTDCTPSYYRFWAVAWAESDACIGLVNYHDGNIRSRRGIATEALSAMIEHCFGTLGLHRLQAFIDPGNAASRGLVEKLGFRCEGLLREHLRVEEVWRDDLVYGLLASEWGGQQVQGG